MATDDGGNREQPALVLASASPRRRDLLNLLGRPFAVEPAAVEEIMPPGEEPAVVARALAEQKARVVAALRPAAVVIGADTVVAVDGMMLGKPDDEADALAMLRRLRGRAHMVVTGLAVARGERLLTASVAATVAMRAAGDDELRAYIATGEPHDKAGAYAVQGLGGALVSAVEGCWLTVVGLPICHLGRLLGEIGLPPTTDVPAACAARTGRPCAPGCCLVAEAQTGAREEAEVGGECPADKIAD